MPVFCASREVIVGRHSKVWLQLARRLAARGRSFEAIGHLDVRTYSFSTDDRVWVFSFSRSDAENAALLSALRRSGVREIVYVSSSSTIVTRRTTCYSYPQAKAQAEALALASPNARVLTIGLMYESIEELPAGACIATSYSELAAFLDSPEWGDDPARRRLLFGVVHRPMRSGLERIAHRWYGRALDRCGAYPCVLRPVDMLLRALGVRWYGYVYLSNALWTSTIS